MRDGGYFLRDERANGGSVLEAVTYTCTHCCRVVVMNPERKRDRAFCYKCNHVICDQCGAAKECTPIQAQFEKDLHG